MDINSQLVKRLKSLLWRAGMMGVAIALTFIIDNLAELQLNPGITVFLGLVLGEISKYLNTAK